MKHEKLKEIYGKQRNFMKWGLWCALPVMAALSVALVLAFNSALDFDESFVILGLVTIVCLVFSIIFGRKETKYAEFAEDYIIIKIMELIKENGISLDCFEIIQLSENEYKIGFHNQKVDYDALQSKIDYEVSQMNNIAHRTIRITLI